MRLGLILLTMARAPKLPYRFRGKNRIVKKPSLHDLLKMKLDFEREEQNMLILRHPYLTIEQGRIKVGMTQKQENIKNALKESRDRFTKNITIADRLSHLRVTEAWD